MAMRLTAEKAVSVARAFVQLQHRTRSRATTTASPRRRASVSGGASFGPFVTTSTCR
jgi:hypothetical protein